MTDYWPWWAGAIGLALVTLFYTLTTDRSLGVSAAWDRVLHWREERELERLDAAFDDDEALQEALALATAEEFGAPAAGHGASSSGGIGKALDSGQAGSDIDSGRAASTAAPAPRPAPLATHAALLISVFVGGLLAAVVAGRFELRLDMGEAYRTLVTDNPIGMVVTLFVGGVLVGFGTRLAGGCSSGHGLSGCGRLRPVSLVATAVFFGTAVVVSFLLWKVI